MQMSDSREIAAAPDVVFNALLDAAVLKEAVPGAQEVEGTPEDGYTATVVQKVGPVKATFKGSVTMSDIVPNEKLTIMGEGKGGSAGFAKGGAVVTLAPSGEGTLLSYEVEAKVGGKLAQLGSRLIDGFAKKMADQFFVNLQSAIEGPTEEESSEDEGSEADQEPQKKKGWLGKLTGKD